MEKTAYICGYYNFPKGSAAANYVQNFANALLSKAYKVVLITNLNTRSKIKDNDFIRNNRDRLTVHGITLPNAKVRHYLAFNFGLYTTYTRALDDYCIHSNDILIAYSPFPQINRAVLKKGEKTGAKTFACVVEWFTYKEYPYGRIDWRYWRNCYNFYSIFPKFDAVIPISMLLESHFKSIGMKSMVVPIMSDPYEYMYEVRKDYDIKKYIFPANGQMKDDLGLVLKAFSFLDSHEKAFVELHLTGIKKKSLIKLCGQEVYEKISDLLHIHDWLEYEDLVSLYQKMNYLVIARKRTRMTLANFPSKVPEALNYGTIPIVAKVGDYTSIYLNDENSIIFEAASENDCIDAIKRSVHLEPNVMKTMEVAARKTSCDKFYYGVWADRLVEFIESI